MNTCNEVTKQEWLYAACVARQTNPNRISRITSKECIFAGNLCMSVATARKHLTGRTVCQCICPSFIQMLNTNQSKDRAGQHFLQLPRFQAWTWRTSRQCWEATSASSRRPGPGPTSAASVARSAATAARPSSMWRTSTLRASSHINANIVKRSSVPEITCMSIYQNITNNK